MIGAIKLAGCGESSGVFVPGEVAAVHDGSSERCAMAAEELGERVQDNIGSIFDRPQEDGRCDRIVDEQWHPVGMSYLRQLLDVADISGRVANTLAVDRPCLV